MSRQTLLTLALAALSLLSCPTPALAATAATPAAVVQADLRALNDNDLEAFLALYAPQAQIFGLPKDPRRLAGPRLEQMYGADKLRASFAKAMAEPATPKIQQTESIALGELLVGKVRIDVPGQSEPTVMMVVYRVRDGLIQDLWHVVRESDDNRGHAAAALATMHALVETSNRADADGFLALFAADSRHNRMSDDPDRLAEEQSKNIVDAASRDRVYRALYAKGDGLQVQTLSAFAVGDLVAMHERITDTAKPGEVKELVSILRVRDGLVRDLWPLQRVMSGAAVAGTGR
ncbi:MULTISPECIES: nuclear transport factor 2 family protein [unclassified Lysobacter]|uniref:nuclear transport factor 2 family protein n=1 Tax=unclassified Lysobacter TaxID=2635362 RepID=UPI001BE66645|nr:MULTISPECIES: nuclear transport factor 2 family protein [unclassified Lysobacter]MBT2745849.1 nuclear transport factor 2 family protein [Lysobacter sp. ISL-42]MBT2749592.1 nuclear transport factor 2 family protein [Lysobacter sp. ISL-50]MBT2778764.1 nuclear transport factor 2 family protein [Lysobacter sp. ISL-54]MBT2781359.1 nuclear transport factor 2 family protein [Lysobacter sp. ISL-52]